jgi:hypothetical protein
VLALAVAGCGGPDRREEVDSYLRDANAIQKRATPELNRANKVYVAFARQELSGADAALKLAAAERAIRATRAKLATLDPPSDARTLHRRLLHLYDLDASMAAETRALGNYLPAAQRTLEPLAGVNRRLRGGLRGTKDPAQQGAALRQFATGLASIVAGLRELAPPPLLLPTHREQVARLDRTGKLALRLQDAIRARDPKAVARTLVRFRKLSEDAGARGSGFETDALRAYTRRYDDLARAGAAVERERGRLERELP